MLLLGQCRARLKGMCFQPLVEDLQTLRQSLTMNPVNQNKIHSTRPTEIKDYPFSAVISRKLGCESFPDRTFAGFLPGRYGRHVTVGR